MTETFCFLVASFEDRFPGLMRIRRGEAPSETLQGIRLIVIQQQMLK